MESRGYWDKFIRQRVNRRRALIGTAGIGAGLVAVSLVGCSSDDDGGGDQPSTSSPPSTQPTTQPTISSGETAGNNPVVDRLVVAVNYSGEESKNNVTTGGGVQAWIHRPHVETLLVRDRETGQVIPNLATEWEVDPSFTSIHFTLRKGVQFHDGWGEMTAEDVAWNYNEHMRLVEGEATAITDRVVSVDVLGDYEILMHLEKPDPEGLNWFATDHYSQAGILSKKHWESVGDPESLDDPAVAATGPYKLVEWKAGESILFEAVEDHWRRTPDFKELEYRIINENSTRLAALLAGEVHVAILPTDITESAVERGMQAVKANLAAYHTWMMFYGGATRRTDTGEFRFPDSPLTDMRVRKAYNKAVDRPALNQAFLKNGGEMSMGVSHFHPVQHKEIYDTSWDTRWPEEHGFDPDEASKLLTAAGFNSDNQLTPTVFRSYQVGVPEGPDMQEAIMGYWSALGSVNPSMLSLDRATERAQARNHEHEHHFWMGSSSTLAVSRYRIGHTNSASAAARDPTYTGDFDGVNTKEFEDLIFKTLGEPNSELFNEGSRQVGEIAFSQHMDMPLFWLPTTWVVNPEVVKGWSVSGGLSGLFSSLEYVQAVQKT